MKYYTIYQTTNLINNKIYIGLHATDNINDSYLGSGVFLKKAIKKYGYTNFKKEIIFVFDNKTDMIKKEKEIVNESFITRKDTYNMSKGGYGLSTLSESKRLETIAKIRKSNLERDHTESSKQRLQTMLNDDPDIFKKIAIKSSKKQKDSYLNGYINPNQNLSDLLIYNQDNEIVFRIKRIDLPDLCAKHDLPERVLIKSIHNNGLPLYLKQAPRKEAYLKYKGWYALYENNELN